VRKRRYRHREPVFSKGFTIFLIVLAVAAGGVALFFILDTYPGREAEIRVASPAGYEDFAYNNNGNGNTEYQVSPTNAPEEPNPSTNPNDYEPDNTSSNTTTYNPTPTTEPIATTAPNEPNTSTHINGTLLTEVDNTLLPWYLKLVNRYNSLDYYFMPYLNPVGGGHYFDARAYRALLDMLDSARADGLSPIVISSFRSVSRQTTLFNNRIQRFIDENGYSEEDAFEAARRIVAYPGTSEHNLGLAVDIVSNSYHGLTERQATTPEGMWLAENSFRYGFVLRYPDDKQHITNIIFEPWHFRYVGVYAATEMFERGLVLEEFVSELLTR